MEYAMPVRPNGRSAHVHVTLDSSEYLLRALLYLRNKHRFRRYNGERNRSDRTARPRL